MQIHIDIHEFTGPMDLLLQLIEKEKVDVFDIPISKITGQYLDVIHQLKSSKSPEEMADFLVMATTLMQIKSRMILQEPEDEEEDPREVLALRLIEYKRMKERARELESALDHMEPFYGKPQEDLSIFEKEAPLLTEDIEILREIFERLIVQDTSYDFEVSIIEQDEFPVEHYIDYLWTRVQDEKKVSLNLLFSNRKKQEKIVIFLAILELMKKERFYAKRKITFIMIEREDHE